ncbi:chorismate mutase [Streptacidiphilus fuscans]|uniref:Chorismate mutase n=1 Tax=Streptacidiphilus fuscans TaxID=2789292 RepID=A0A931B4P0_9ACTN|nr:chorismate mutase [Streptacidiphilus fuscans]MBF9067853.1 chorismate mutase [Streptacidiphilus fuscans]
MTPSSTPTAVTPSVVTATAVTPTAVTPTAVPAATTSLSRESAEAVIAEARGRIDALDAQILDLVQRRITVSAEVQQARIATGGPRLSLTREMEILERFRDRLGRPGTDIAMLLLELCRGRV